MSIDNYAIHILQKYRLAIALAVLKTKPENLTLEEHIEQLRSKFRDEDMDLDNFNISIDSDDFKFHDNNDFYNTARESNEEIQKHEEIQKYEEIQKHEEFQKHEELLPKTNEQIDNGKQNKTHDTHNELNDDQDINDVIMTDTQDLNDSITILANFEHVNEVFSGINTETNPINNLSEVMDIIKRIDDGTLHINEPVTTIDRLKSNEEYDIFSQMTVQEDLTQCCTDTEMTQCESVVMNKQNIVNSDLNRSQAGIEVLNNKSNDEGIAKSKVVKEGIPIQATRDSSKHMNVENSKTHDNHTNTKETSCIRNYRHRKEFKNIYQNVANIFDTTSKMKDNKVELPNIKVMNSQVIGQSISNENNNLKKSHGFNDTTIVSNDVNYDNLTNTCNTHYSQSQTNIVTIDEKLLHGIKRNNNILKTEADVSKKRKNNIIIIQDEVIYKPTYENVKRQNEITDLKTILENTNSVIDINEKTMHAFTEDDIFAEDLPDVSMPSQKTQIYDSNNEDLSFHRTQDENYSRNHRLKDSLGFEQYTDNFENNIHRNKERNAFLESQERCVDVGNNYNEDSLRKPNIFNTDDIETAQTEIGISSINFDDKIDSQAVENHNFTQTLNKEPNENSNKIEDRTNITNEANKISTNFDNDIQEIEDAEVSDTETEKVPFKIIEELNKVKIYLNKMDKSQRIFSSSDTGYRSDLSAKNSLRTSQASLTWLDQSAFSLYNYITTCPLVKPTQDITKEISSVLGQLIDKLHDEEKYPVFLESMMDSIQQLLGLIYEDNIKESVLKQKDEYIHRIILFNKSTHIQKFTIEKITQHLEKIHKELTTKDTDYEIKNITQIENACYIFHLLEIILQKHRKSTKKLSQNTENSSQTANLTQNSQIPSQNSQKPTQNDEKTLKKSSIMDIWRKKWNGDVKEVQNVGSQEKNCEVTKCCAVLNKIVVECMEGYSLISYFALKCFNVVQN